MEDSNHTYPRLKPHLAEIRTRLTKIRKINLQDFNSQHILYLILIINIQRSVYNIINIAFIIPCHNYSFFCRKFHAVPSTAIAGRMDPDWSAFFRVANGAVSVVHCRRLVVYRRLPPVTGLLRASAKSTTKRNGLFRCTVARSS